MKAMLLAAGAGSRLRPLTDRVPKPLAPIANVPLLERTLSWLAGEGVTDVMVNVHHHAAKISGAIGSGDGFGLAVHYSVENELLGTSGAVQRCAEFFRDEPFYVVYGDNLIDADLGRLREFHKSKNAVATIALFTPDDPSACGMVDVSPDGRIERFVEKPKPGESQATMANAGVYILNPSLLSTLPGGFSDFGKNMFPAWLDDGRPLFAAALGGYLQDTGTPDRYRKANWDVLAGTLRYEPRGVSRQGAIMDRDAVISPNVQLVDRNVIGARCTIDAEVTLQNCIVWPDAKIGAGSNLTNVIVGESAIIEAGTVADNTILV